MRIDGYLNVIFSRRLNEENKSKWIQILDRQISMLCQINSVGEQNGASEH